VIYLLDTNALSDLIRADPRMTRWVSSLKEDDRLVTCTIVRGEILFGIARLAQGRRRVELEQKAEKLFAALPCEPIPPFAGDVYAAIKLAQQQCGLIVTSPESD
jgi:predicted nucleic acid-binding protein